MPQRNADGDGFNLIFRPGPGFFEDYERYYVRRFQRELQLLYTADAHAIQHPQEMVLYFYRKLYDTDEVDELGFTERETAFAASLLEKHDTKEIEAFIDYALEEAKKTNFDIKTFGGIKKYYLPYTRELSRRARKSKLEDEKRHKEKEGQALASYNLYYQESIDNIRHSTSEEELARLEGRVRTELETEHPGSKIMTAWVRHRVNRLLAQKHKVFSFGEWQKRCG